MAFWCSVLAWCGVIITVIIISTELLALCDGCLGWGWIWRAGLVAGLWVGQAFGVLLLPGFGVSSSSPQVPRHPTSTCDAGVNSWYMLACVYTKEIQVTSGICNGILGQDGKAGCNIIKRYNGFPVFWLAVFSIAWGPTEIWVKRSRFKSLLELNTLTDRASYHSRKKMAGCKQIIGNQLLPY